MTSPTSAAVRLSISVSVASTTPVEHGREIVRLVKGLECRVNLIRFHQIPNVDLPGADLSRMEQLRDYLTANGVFTTIRASRGQDIFAACGLLSTEKKKNQKQ